MVSKIRRVCVVLIDRANYGRLLPVMGAIKVHPKLELQVICGGSMVLPRFHRPVEMVRKDGFAVDREVYCEVEGSTHASMARSAGLACIQFADAFEQLDPDFVVVIGDRFEAFGAASAAAISGRRLVHFQGGEQSGAIDHRLRWAISELADYHVPATTGAKHRLADCLIDGDFLACGCPVADLAAEISVPPHHRILVAFHPDTADGQSLNDLVALLEALGDLGHRPGPVTIMWPNIDAGSAAFHLAIRQWRRYCQCPDWLEIQTNHHPWEWLRLLAGAAVAVGNSSSFVRDSSFFGTPVVLVGDRQRGRECGPNVERVKGDKKEIKEAILWQAEHGPYEPSELYGKPGVSRQVAERLATIQLEPRAVRDPGSRGVQTDPAEESAGGGGQVPVGLGG